ncbi:MAG TPA: 4-alpha-glucanotransferase [Mariprofundaceae bacterium]|nr:4-alpha-glucanotransferase [Mariprofundaceae bacterium]
MSNPTAWMDRRRSAILLHITSLPSPFHKGVLGEEAFHFIDTMVAGGFSVWQFLPLGPTHSHGSPYESLSTFAGNPELIDLRPCLDADWLPQNTSFKHVTREQHASYRKEAAHQFWLDVQSNTELAQQVSTFQTQHAYWLDDFSLFSALKSASNNAAWWQWSDDLRTRNEVTLQAARETHNTLIQQVIFEQFLFDKQWQGIKTYAESKGVQLFGDLPIYVAHDSADVWANPQFFTLDESGECTEVAGVPPDYFSKTGQRWGNPLYRWDVLQADDFSWWVKRIAHQLTRMDMLRIDHFLALEAFWVIPAESDTGLIGEWRKAPGKELLQTLQDKLGNLPLIAEDLGTITEEVTTLRKQFGLPGMKILHFAFGGDDSNPYLPHNHEEDSVVYTGTHDNDTTMGWFESSDEHVQQHVLNVLHAKAEDMPWALIEAALASPARLAVIPMQDILELGSEAKFNTPGTLDGNWSWRLDVTPSSDHVCWQKSNQLNQAYNR